MVFDEITGEDKEININTNHPEFLDWKWIELDQLTKVVVDFKLHVYKEVQKCAKNPIQTFKFDIGAIEQAMMVKDVAKQN